MQTKPIPDYIASQGFSKTIFKRFFSKIEYTGTCWIWKGAVCSDGYGSIFRGIVGFPRTISTHRLSWLIHFGPIENGMLVCHECDNAACVNPAHLWIGTQIDNMIDMSRKGRASQSGGVKGEKNNQAKLTIETARKIRSEYIPNKIGFTRLSKKYGVSYGCVYAIIHNWTWVDEVSDLVTSSP